MSLCTIVISLLRNVEKDCNLTLQARQDGSESLVFEDNDEDEVWELESRVATQPLDLKGISSVNCQSITCLDSKMTACP